MLELKMLQNEPTWKENYKFAYFSNLYLTLPNVLLCNNLESTNTSKFRLH